MAFVIFIYSSSTLNINIILFKIFRNKSSYCKQKTTAKNINGVVENEISLIKFYVPGVEVCYKRVKGLIVF